LWINEVARVDDWQSLLAQTLSVTVYFRWWLINKYSYFTKNAPFCWYRNGSSTFFICQQLFGISISVSRTSPRINHSRIDQLNRFIRISKAKCHFPSEHNLTLDESAAIFMYTYASLKQWMEKIYPSTVILQITRKLFFVQALDCKL